MNFVADLPYYGWAGYISRMFKCLIESGSVRALLWFVIFESGITWNVLELWPFRQMERTYPWLTGQTAPCLHIAVSDFKLFQTSIVSVHLLLYTGCAETSRVLLFSIKYSVVALCITCSKRQLLTPDIKKTLAQLMSCPVLKLVGFAVPNLDTTDCTCFKPCGLCIRWRR